MDKTTYADINLTIPNTNPVVLTAAGRQPNIFFNGSAKAILRTSAGVQIEVRDPVGGETAKDSFADWNALIVYNLNDIVQGSDDLYYTSIGNANSGNDPTSTSNFWMEVRFINVWETAYTYATGLVAIGSDSNLYISRVDSNIGNDPVSSPTEWRLTTVPNGTIEGQTLSWNTSTLTYEADDTLLIDRGNNIAAFNGLDPADFTAYGLALGSLTGNGSLFIKSASGFNSGIFFGDVSTDTANITYNNVSDTFVFQDNSGTLLTIDSSIISAGGLNISILALTAGGIVSVNDTTEATSTTAASLQTDGGLGVVKDAIIGGDAIIAGFLNLGSAVELTISAGVVTATGSNHVIDTEADVATDDLNTINGGTIGDILHLSAINANRTVVLKDGVANLALDGDFSLTHRNDTIVLRFSEQSVWIEESRSDNTV